MKYPLNRKTRRGMNIAISDEIGGVPRMQRMQKKINRNDPCPCGSGLKFKNCVECYSKYGESRQYYTNEMIEEAMKNFGSEDES